MKLAKLLLATSLFVSVGALAQSTPPTTAAPTAPTGSTGEGGHHHHWMHQCVHQALAAQNIEFPGSNATPAQKQAFFEAKHAAKEKCWAEKKAGGANTTAPTH